eukprot:jgi/Ulvmu1/8688/UM047_0028.1
MTSVITNYQQEVDIADKLPHEYFPEVCWLLGMKQQAAYGWAQLHIKPHIMCTAYISSIAGILTASAVLYGGGLSWPNLVIHSPYAIATCSLVLCAALVWRFGPRIVSTPVYKIALAVYSTASGFLHVASIAGPGTCVPFSSRLLAIVGAASVMLPGFCSTVLGGGEAEHPPEPHNTVRPLLVNAAFSTMRFIDVMSDMGFVRILLDQGPNCTWYGKTTPCSLYKRLGFTVATLALLNLVLMAIAASLGGQAILMGGRHHRLRVAIAVNSVLMLLEVAGITIALAKVFSDMQLPESSNNPQLRLNAAVAIISCACTMTTFCVNMVGMHRMLRVVMSSAKRVPGMASLIAYTGSILPSGSLPSGNVMPPPITPRLTLPAVQGVNSARVVPSNNLLQPQESVLASEAPEVASRTERAEMTMWEQRAHAHMRPPCLCYPGDSINCTSSEIRYQLKQTSNSINFTSSSSWSARRQECSGACRADSGTQVVESASDDATAS